MLYAGEVHDVRRIRTKQPGSVLNLFTLMAFARYFVQFSSNHSPLFFRQYNERNFVGVSYLQVIGVVFVKETCTQTNIFV
jgi:hypothetical protein